MGIARPNNIIISTLVALFIFASNVVAIHDIDHLSHEHSDYCDLVLSADHNAASEISSALSCEIPQPAIISTGYPFDIATSVTYAFLARAPPAFFLS